MALFDWVQRRLAFLSKDETLFAAIGKLQHRTYASKFVIYLGGERKGRILEFSVSGEDWRFIFGNGVELSNKDLVTLDKPLLNTFEARAAAL